VINLLTLIKQIVFCFPNLLADGFKELKISRSSA